MVGLDVPVRPQRGQLIVTEKTAPFLRYPVATVRQTDEGGVMLGDSQEEAGFDPTVGTPVIAVLADRALRMFPQLGSLNIVRTWAALRVMTQDGFPDLRAVGELPRRVRRHLPFRRDARRQPCARRRAVHRAGRAAARHVRGLQCPEVRCSSAA